MNLISNATKLFLPCLGGESAFLHGQQKPTCPSYAGCFPALAASTCPAKLVIWNNRTRIVNAGLFSPGPTWRWGLFTLVQVFPLQEERSEIKHLQIPPCPSDGLGMVCSCKVGGRLSKGNIFLSSLENRICWKGKHSWIRNWGCRSSFFHKRWAGSLTSLSLRASWQATAESRRRGWKCSENSSLASKRLITTM